jgi:hypothetical protein
MSESRTAARMRGNTPFLSFLLSPHTANDHPKAGDAHSIATSSRTEPDRMHFIMHVPPEMERELIIPNEKRMQPEHSRRLRRNR